MTSDLFDRRQVRRAFARAARSYDAAATLQHDVEAHLLDSLSYMEQRAPTPPQVLVDIGCGPGRAAASMQQRWPKARVLALDLAMPMLRARAETRRWHPLRRDVQRVCADAAALPLVEGCVDVLFSNLCLQWVDDLPAVLAGFR
ncbi:MAG: malonyl-CoA O-methyltransferase, partial [Xanthomonadaceae bacterium]|nr:malonyl-CoA O-methyltransferase [Xanthomonadaceae bacterium]